MSENGWKHWLSLQAASGLQRCGWKGVPGQFGILMYHRIADAVPGVPFPTWNVTPERFREQLSGLLKLGYRPWSLNRVLQAQVAGEALPARVFVVTFDDGYVNNLTAALPILRELQVPATLFVATGFLNSPHPFPNDDWCAAGTSHVPVESWRPITTAELHQLHESEWIEIGCHTHTHADFRGRPDLLASDLQQSLEVLNEELGIAAPVFAFPYGTKHLGFADPELLDVVRAAGCRCSLNTESVPITWNSSPYDWGRFTATQTDTPRTLAAKLDGCYTFVRQQWQRLRGAGAAGRQPSETRSSEHALARALH
jgi:peptidoglycan/xylan/chitin deacetylase (PgdA/CDA1 family)